MFTTVFQELNNLSAELDELRSKADSEKINITEKIQLTKRARYFYMITGVFYKLLCFLKQERRLE